jgi:hypothetical protein
MTEEELEAYHAGYAEMEKNDNSKENAYKNQTKV